MGERPLVVVKGGGDIASGIVFRLVRCGFAVAITEVPRPTTVRRRVAFAEAVYSGAMRVEGVEARLASPDLAHGLAVSGIVPVVVDPPGALVRWLRPPVVVDAIMAKRNAGTTLADAPIVIGVGPGFRVGANVHAVVETNRGHNLGRVIWEGEAEPDTCTPAPVLGYTHERVLRAPCDGIAKARKSIGDPVEAGQVLAVVGSTPVTASIPGIVRGLIHSGCPVNQGTKIGDIDPTGRLEHCFTISDKSLAVAGGVLEAILSLLSKPGPGGVARGYRRNDSALSLERLDGVE